MVCQAGGNPGLTFSYRNASIKIIINKGDAMDLDALRLELAERYPPWWEEIGVLELRESADAAPMDNDGRVIFYNGRHLHFYPQEQQLFYLAQQLLHLRLAHAQRGEGKDAYAWKKASDAVVNAMLLADGFELPEDAVLPPPGSAGSAEELYGLLLGEEKDKKTEDGQEDQKSRKPKPTLKGRLADVEQGSREREISDPGLAEAIAGLADLLEPSMQLDYDWFPGDTIRDGMLLERFKPYPVPHAEILLDTSASVDAELLRAFVRGVKGLLQSDAVVRVGCFDTEFYGFQEIRTEQDIDKLELRGAGGTNFEAAIHAFTGDAETRIIFTDGYAEMPEERCDAIWLVYSDMPVHPKGGRVIYVKKPEEKETHEIDFLIT